MDNLGTWEENPASILTSSTIEINSMQTIWNNHYYYDINLSDSIKDLDSSSTSVNYKMVDILAPNYSFHSTIDRASDPADYFPQHQISAPLIMSSTHATEKNLGTNLLQDQEVVENFINKDDGISVILSSSVDSESSGNRRSINGTHHVKRKPAGGLLSSSSSRGFQIFLDSSGESSAGMKKPRNNINIDFFGRYEPDVDAVKEMMYRAAALRPVMNYSSLGGRLEEEEAAGNFLGKKKSRKNVRISSDPQTVAARQRRERISERLRILQKMVPGGSKMDTASMLDEAANYLKFLKTQLSLLYKP